MQVQGSEDDHCAAAVPERAGAAVLLPQLRLQEHPLPLPAACRDQAPARPSLAGRRCSEEWECRRRSWRAAAEPLEQGARHLPGHSASHESALVSRSIHNFGEPCGATSSRNVCSHSLEDNSTNMATSHCSNLPGDSEYVVGKQFVLSTEVWTSFGAKHWFRHTCMVPHGANCPFVFSRYHFCSRIVRLPLRALHVISLILNL